MNRACAAPLLILLVQISGILGAANETITVSSAILNTPTTGPLYSNDFHYRWLVAPTNPLAYLTFDVQYFDIEGYASDSTCSNDYIAFYDSATAKLGDACDWSNRDQSFAIYCNFNEPPAAFSSDAKSVTVEFCTDSFIMQTGATFKVYTHSSPAPSGTTAGPVTEPPVLTCGSNVMLNVTGFTTVESPAHPNAYPPNVKCLWIVHAPAGSGIRVESINFGVEGYTNDCQYDVLEIAEEQGKSKKYCRANGPMLSTDKSSLNISFSSDDSVEFHGFRLQVSAQGQSTTMAPNKDCNQIFTLNKQGDSFNLQSPNWPDFYPNDENCANMIENASPAEGLVIQFRFLSFSTEPSRDVLTVIDNDDVSTFSGFINTNQMEVFHGRNLTTIFDTDSSATFDGYAIEVSLQDPAFTCEQGFYKCNSSRQCVPFNQFCDGTEHCRDGSDEQNPICSMQSVCGHQDIDPNLYIPNQKMIGGTTAKPGSWPWTVAIKRGGYPLCTGTLLTNNIVLSAAGCFSSTINPSGISVEIGSYHMMEMDSPFEYQMPVDSIWIHPDFDRSNYNNDYALIFLHQSVPFNTHINVACLPRDGTFVAEHDVCVITGWGSMTIDQQTSEVLKQVVAPVIPSDVCNDAQHYDGQVVAQTQLCAGDDTGANDFCYNDQGSPLSCRSSKSGKWEVRGVASYHPSGCFVPMKPGVFSRVSQAIPWIVELANRFA